MKKLTVCLIALMLVLTACSPKVTLSDKDFTSAMSNLGYETFPVSNEEIAEFEAGLPSGSISTMTIATNETSTIYFMTTKTVDINGTWYDEDIAIKVYDDTKAEVEGAKSEADFYESTMTDDSATYTQSLGTGYAYLSRVQNTVLYAVNLSEYGKSELKEHIKSLGY